LSVTVQDLAKVSLFTRLGIAEHFVNHPTSDRNTDETTNSLAAFSNAGR